MPSNLSSTKTVVAAVVVAAAVSAAVANEIAPCRRTAEERGFDKALPDRLGRRLGTREHALDWPEKRQFRAMQLGLRREDRNLPDVAEKHVRFFHIVELRVESSGDRFFDETFAQTDPKIARENFYNVLALARGKLGESTLQQFGLRDWSPCFVQAFEEFAGLDKGKRLRCRPAIECFEGGFACVTVSLRDAAKFRIAQFCSRSERAINHRPAHLSVRRSLCGNALPVK